MLGAAAVAQSPPDGYTFLLGTGSTHGTNSSVYSKLSYDPVRDFVPVALVTTSPLVLIVPPSLPANTVGELIALARSKPGELSFGSYGTGSINHLGGELFNSMAKIQANHIPYRGAAPAMTDLIAGRLHYTFDGVATSLGYARAGTIRLLGVAAPQRSPVLPDQPTISESGLPGFDTMVWFGLFAPAGTPKAIVETDEPKDERRPGLAERQGGLREARDRRCRRSAGGSRRQGPGGNAEVGEHRAREEHPRRSVIRRASACTGEPGTSRREPDVSSQAPDAISAYSCSARATTRPAGARKGRRRAAAACR